MAALTARRAINDALRSPVQSDGWAPRAAGWFTRDLGDGWTGVVAASVAVSSLPAGHGYCTLHVSARHDEIEDQVAALCGLRPTYKVRTVKTSIGYLMPDPHWHEWLVTPETAEGVADAMAESLRLYGLPHLDSLRLDVDAVLSATASWLLQSPDYARHVLLTRRFRGVGPGRALLAETRQSLEGRKDPAAIQTHEVLDAVERALTA